MKYIMANQMEYVEAIFTNLVCLLFRLINSSFERCLTHLFPMYPLSNPSLKTLENCKIFCCCQGVEKGCTGNEWVN